MEDTLRRKQAAAESLPRIGGLHGGLVLLMTSLLAACGGPTRVVTPAAPTSVEITNPTQSPSPANSATWPSPAATPSATVLPRHVYFFRSRQWPEVGSLLTKDVDGTEFILEVSRLPSGDYLLLADERTKAAIAYSVESGEMQTLFMPDLAEFGPRQIVDGSGNLMAGSHERAGYWRLYDLHSQEAWGLGPVCRGFGNDWISPDGAWIGTVCGDFVQQDGIAFDHVLVQFLSPKTGTGMQFVVPINGLRNDTPDLAWNNDGRAILTHVWIEDGFRACSISPAQGDMYCPPLGLHGAAADPLVNIRSPWLAFGGTAAFPNQKLVPRSCFEVGAACDAIIEVTSEKPIALLPTSDPGIVWWIERRGPDPTSEFGLFGPDTGEMTQIASLGGTYFAPANCPDGSCLILFNPDTELNWRLNLDGTLEVLPFRGDVVVGAFRIP